MYRVTTTKREIEFENVEDAKNYFESIMYEERIALLVDPDGKELGLKTPLCLVYTLPVEERRLQNA